MSTSCYYSAGGTVNKFDSGQATPCGTSEPGWSNASSGVQLCCIAGDSCGANGLCKWSQYTSHPATGSGYYVGSCTDPTFRDPLCSSDCSKYTWGSDIVFVQAPGTWACCGKTTDGLNNPDCNITLNDQAYNIGWAPSDFPGPVNKQFSLAASTSISPKTSSTSASQTTQTSSSQATSSTSTVASGTSATSTTASTAATLIPASSSSASPTPAAVNSGLSPGAQTGIGVGVGLGALALTGLAIFLFMQKRRAKRAGNTAPDDNTSPGNMDAKEDLSAAAMGGQATPYEVETKEKDRAELEDMNTPERSPHTTKADFSGPLGGHVMSHEVDAAARDPAELESGYIPYRNPHTRGSRSVESGGQMIPHEVEGIQRPIELDAATRRHELGP